MIPLEALVSAQLHDYMDPTTPNDLFKRSFKFYKNKSLNPDFSEVLDFNKESTLGNEVRKLSVGTDCHTINESLLGLTPHNEWNIFELKNRPGLIFVRNPFTSMGQKYWIQRCLKHYTRKPSRLNLDAHGDLKDDEDWWDVCHRQGQRGKDVRKKLRWATLGYHHNWDTKVYSEDARDPFPEDLAVLSNHVARVAGFDNFNAEAAIVNFYHMDSTLSGHTDHSEVNKEAPLLSISFGQKAIFLIGGPTKEGKPTALFIRSGDIVVMSSSSRLCYHGVPKIMETEESPWDSILSGNSVPICDDKCDESVALDCSNGSCSCHLQEGDLGTQRKSLLCGCRECVETERSSETPVLFRHFVDKYVNNNALWEPFKAYVRTSRINVNIRQVLLTGQKSLQ